MSAVVSAVSDVVGGAVDAVGSAVNAVGNAVGDVANAVGDTVQKAIDNPIQTAAVIASIANPALAPVLIPAGSAAQALDNGASFDDALKSAAVSYVATAVGAQVAPSAGSYAAELGADAATQAAVQGATRAAVSSATGAALTGGDIGDAMVRSLASYGLRQGIDYGINELGQAVDSVTGEILADSDGTMSSSLTGEEGINATDIAGPTPDESFDGQEVGTDIDAFGNEIGDVNPYAADIGAGTEEVSYDVPSYAPGISEGSPEGDMPEVGTEVDALGAEIGDTNPYATPIADLQITPPVEEAYTPGISESSPEGDMPEVGTDVDAFGNEITDTNPYAATYEPGVDYPLVDQAEIDAAPDAIDMDAIPEGDSDIIKAAKNYFQRQLTGQLTGNLMRDIFNTGAPSASNVPRYGQRYLPSGMRDLSTDVLSSLSGQGLFSDTEASSLADAEPTVDLGSNELFNPLGTATWAPQSKIGGLGFAGKYINRDADTYYISKEQEDRQKALEKLQSGQGWITDEERQQLMDQAGVEDPNVSPFYDAGSFDGSQFEFAEGGLAGHNPEFYSEGGASIGNRYVKGAGDGTSDSVPAMLASGEFVIPADVVSGLGNGDNDAGAKVLDSFMEEIRRHKRGGSAKQLPPDSKGPLSYLSSAMTKAKRK